MAKRPANPAGGKGPTYISELIRSGRYFLQSAKSTEEERIEGKHRRRKDFLLFGFALGIASLTPIPFNGA